ncbi:Tyrosine kinase catalytic domain protein [Ceratobasidium sp. AG-Ba]|nr:Tyrosine kinase catalytic domain protein [Ceratobasidium sp. AG-Ba]
MSKALQERATFLPPAKYWRPRQIAKGSASDIWVVTGPDISVQRVWKVPRINPARFTGNVPQDLSKRSWESISRSGLTFGLDMKKFTIKKPIATTRTPVATVSASGDRTAGPQSTGSSPLPNEGNSHLWAEFLQTYCAKLETWASLRHENVVRVFGFGEGLNLEVDYYENGCVRDYLTVHKAVNKSIMIRDIIAGVNYLHEHHPPIVHGSLNAGKMFVDRYGKTLVGEFSLSTLLHPLSEHVPDISFAGSSRWFSPELLENPTAQFTEKSDIWALGCTLYEILAEKIPYSSQRHEIKAQQEILNHGLPGDLELDVLNSSTVVQLWPMIKSCWSPDAADRPAASDLAVQVGQSINDDIQRDLIRTARELYTWSLCDHKNIAKLLGLAIFSDRIAMVSRWMTHGNVAKYLSHNDVDRVRLCVEVSEGLVYLHKEGIANVLISEDGSALLTDFGEAELIDPATELLFTRPSSPIGINVRWAAPEYFLGDKDYSSTSADVYALAMTILEIITGQIPFGQASVHAVVYGKINNEIPQRPQTFIPENSPDGDKLWLLLCKCWSREPADRPTSGEVLETLRSISQEGLNPPTERSSKQAEPEQSTKSTRLI